LKSLPRNEVRSMLFLAIANSSLVASPNSDEDGDGRFSSRGFPTPNFHHVWGR
jgi:hypothetical protein